MEINISRVKHELLRLKMSQRELAKALGVSECSVSRYMIGDRSPKWNAIQKMAEIMSVTPEYLCGFDVGNEEKSLSSYAFVRENIKQYVNEWTFDQKKELLCLLIGGN